METISTFVFSIGLIIFAAHFFTALFERTRFPDVLPLILIGILNNGLNILGVSSFIQEIVIGITILLAVLISIIRKNNIESK